MYFAHSPANLPLLLPLSLPTPPPDMPPMKLNLGPMVLTSSIHTPHTTDLLPTNLDCASLNLQYIETQLGPTFSSISYDPINGNYLYSQLYDCLLCLKYVFEICVCEM